jgi:hypothetical protein
MKWLFLCLENKNVFRGPILFFEWTAYHIFKMGLAILF